MYHPRYIPIVNDDIISLIVILTYFVTSGSLILFFNFCHQHLQNLQVFEIFLFFLSYLVESKDKAKNGPRTIVVKVSNFKDKRKTLHLANNFFFFKSNNGYYGGIMGEGERVAKGRKACFAQI